VAVAVAPMPSIRDFQRVLLVVNPISGGGRAARKAERVARALRARADRVEVAHTAGPGDGARIVRQLDGDRCLVLAVGGDGTFNEILNGADLGRCTLGIVPAGTGNVLAKELGMSMAPQRIAEQLCGGRVVSLDVGRCNGRRFISVFGAGVDGDVVRRVHAARGDWMSMAHYVPFIVQEALRPKRRHIRVDVDGRALAVEADQVVVGNGHGYGGPFEMTPAAAPNDGVLDVMCAPLASPAERISMVACMVLRCLHLSPLVSYARGRRVSVSSPEPDVAYELDGEAAGVLPAEVAVSPSAVRVLAPASFRPVRREPR